MATDSNGQVVWREGYKPYGERTLGQDQSTSAPGYTGKVHEEALGLSYFGARWYDPELGRFTGIDPVDIKSVCSTRPKRRLNRLRTQMM